MENSDEPPSSPSTCNTYNDLCERWMMRLERSESFADVISVCQDICTATGRTNTTDSIALLPAGNAACLTFPEEMARYCNDRNKWENTTAVTVRLCTIMKDEGNSHSQRKIVAKSYYNVCQQNVLHNAIMTPIYGMHGMQGDDFDEHSVVIYGMLHSKFLKLIHSNPELCKIPEHNLALFLSPAAGYIRWFNTVSENVLTIERLHLFRDVHSAAKFAKMWNVVLMNLESPYQGARENMLMLVKYLIRDEQFMGQTVLPAVARWSWLNRNKYHVLVILLGRYKLSTISQRLNHDNQMLGEALKMSLRYKHLYTGGQGLIRVLHRDQQMAEFVYRLVKNVIEEEDIALVRAMAKYWFSSLSPRDYRHIYYLLELDQLVPEAATGISEFIRSLPAYLKTGKYEKLFFVTNIFRREFQAHVHLNQLLLLLCILADWHKPLPGTAAGLLIETLVHHIIASSNGQSKVNTTELMAKLTRYVLEAIELPGNIHLCTNVAALCRKLFNHIVNPGSGVEIDREAQVMLAHFMSYEMYDRYLLPTGSKELDYQRTVTALRLFASFVELAFEFTPSSRYVLQTRPLETIRWVAKLLPASVGLADIASTFRTVVYGLEHLLRCDFADIRTMTLTMLYNRTVAYHYEPSLQAQLAGIFSQNEALHEARTLNVLLERTILQLTVALDSHREDFYATTVEAEDVPNCQLYRLVDRGTEMCFGFPEAAHLLPDADSFRELPSLVREVTNFSLDALNCSVYKAMKSGMEPPAETSFEIMDRSLQLLLERSAMWNDDKLNGKNCVPISLGKRKMLVALWKALRATAVFAENYAKWILSRVTLRKDTVEEQMNDCYIIFLKILLKCCHRGAIEVTGNCLGRIVKHIMQMKQQQLTAKSAVSAEQHSRFQHVDRLVQWLNRCYRVALSTTSQQDVDFRSRRGFLWLIYSFIRNEPDGSVCKSFLRTYLEQHVRLDRRDKVGVLKLHQLNWLSRETSLNETMLPHIAELMITALTNFRSPEWPVRNAALQLFASCVTKLVGQRQHYVDAECEWPPVYTSFDEILFNVHPLMQFILEQLHPNDDATASTPFLLLVLEFLSKLEYRGYYPTEQQSTVLAYRMVVWKLLRHEHDKVRGMAARCFAQLHDFATDIPAMLENLVIVLFTTSAGNNFRHGLIQAVDGCVRKWVTLGRHLRYGTQNGFPKEDLPAEGHGAMGKKAIFQRVRQLLMNYYKLDEQHHPSATYQYRCALLQLLIFVGFRSTSEIVLQLIFNRTAPNAQGLHVFLMRANQVFNGTAASGFGHDDVIPTEQDQQLPLMPYEMVLHLDQDQEREKDD